MRSVGSITLLLSAVAVVSLVGCTTAAQVATGQAESQQQPAITSYTSKQSADRVFTAATKAMGEFGTIRSSDRSGGIVQGQKGNWVMSANISAAKPGTRIDVSARYVPSKQMDFHSREGLTADYVARLQATLGESLIKVAN